jgi:hypothetical protein
VETLSTYRWRPHTRAITSRNPGAGPAARRCRRAGSRCVGRDAGSGVAVHGAGDGPAIQPRPGIPLTLSHPFTLPHCCSAAAVPAHHHMKRAASKVRRGVDQGSV